MMTWSISTMPWPFIDLELVRLCSPYVYVTASQSLQVHSWMLPCTHSLETKSLNPLEQTYNQHHTRYVYFQHTCTTRTTSNSSQIHTGVHACTSANTHTATQTHDVCTYITEISSSITYSHNQDTYARVHTQAHACTHIHTRTDTHTHDTRAYNTTQPRPLANTQWYSLTRKSKPHKGTVHALHNCIHNYNLKVQILTAAVWAFPPWHIRVSPAIALVRVRLVLTFQWPL
jgi:hypothetical protein